MRADEYIVEQLKITQEQLRIEKNAYNNLYNEYNKLIEQTKLVDELKSYCVTSTLNDRIKSIKITYDGESLNRRVVAYNDEPIFEILVKLLGPLKDEEEVDGQ